MKVRKHIPNFDSINNIELRSDIENGNITGSQLLFLGKTGNIWRIAIDEHFIEYHYTSEAEYNEDVKILIS